MNIAIPRTIRTWLAALVALLMVFAVNAVGSAPAVAEEPAAIRGQVLSWMDPIGFARVSVFDADSGAVLRTVMTDGSGEYMVTGLPAVRVQVRARKAGYLDSWASGAATRAQADVYELSPGQTLVQTWDEDMVLYLDLTPEAVISGTIMGFNDSTTSPYDNPLGGVRVTAFDSATGRALGSALSADSSAGADWGSFRIGMLPAGDVVLRAAKDGWVTTWAHDRWTRATAEVFTVAPFSPVDVGTLAIYAPAGIQGGVMLDDEPVATDVTVSVFDADSGRLLRSIVDDDGYFQVDGLPPVRVKVRASGPFYTTGWATFQTTWDAAEVFPLRPGVVSGELMGTINVIRAATIKGQVLGNFDPLGYARVTVFDASTGAALKSTTCDREGYYTIAKIPVGFAGRDVKVRAAKTGWQSSWADGAWSRAAARTFHLSGGMTLEQSWDPMMLYLDLRPLAPTS